MSDQVSRPLEWTDITELTTMATPAKALCVQAVSSQDQLINAVQQAQQQGLPFTVLGEGSNTVFVGDYPGVVILNQIKGIQLEAESEAYVQVAVAAGESWHQFVAHCVEHDWPGVENLALIPGTVGAAPIQNIGAYGVEVKQFIVDVDVYDVRTKQVQTLSNTECEFAYRDSRFKHDWAGEKIILSVRFRFPKNSQLNLNYPALAQRLPAEPTIRDVFQAVVKVRSEKLPDPKQIPNAGSFFKNPVVSASQFEQLKSRFPEIVAFAQGQDYKLAAAWLIDNAGWKQKDIDGVTVHQKQALVVINPLNRPGEAIKAFAEAIQRDVGKFYQVNLEIEPRLLVS